MKIIQLAVAGSMALAGVGTSSASAADHAAKPWVECKENVAMVHHPKGKWNQAYTELISNKAIVGSTDLNTAVSALRSSDGDPSFIANIESCVTGKLAKVKPNETDESKIGLHKDSFQVADGESPRVPAKQVENPKKELTRK